MSADNVGLDRAVRSPEEAPEDSPPVLSARGVGKVFQSAGQGASVALRGVDFSLGQGEFVSIVGPSGCGKTTVLKICAGLVRPTQGALAFHGRAGPAPAGRFGIVFQRAALLPWRTVVDNVMLPADVLHLPRKQARERAEELLHLVGLDDVEEKYPSELSGGMQQRVAIARSLLHDPSLLFMDEPFGALDALTRDGLNLELQRIHMEQQKTVLFVTHSIREAVLLSDRVLVMCRNPGRIAADVAIAIPRPRSIEHETREDFRDLEVRIRRMLDS